MEIERKYELKQLPEKLSEFSHKDIEQGYLCNNPILRIRKCNESYILTYKSKKENHAFTDGGAIMNNEVELPLTKTAYLKLKEKTEGNIIYKKRFLIPIQDGLIAELDIFEGLLKGFCMVEVEFPDDKAADAFTAPEWFGRELSGDGKFSNHSLSKLTNLSELDLKLGYD